MLAVVCLLGGLLSASLVRFSPGYGVDEREIDFRLNQASVEAIRNSRHLNDGLLSYYGHYLAGAVHGDLGRRRQEALPEHHPRRDSELGGADHAGSD